MSELKSIVVHGEFKEFHAELATALKQMESTFKTKGTELGKVFADAFSAQLKDVNAVFQAIQSASKQAGDSLKNMEAPMPKISSGAKQVSNTFEIANKQIAGMVAAYKDASVSSVNFGKSIQDVNSLASTTLNQTANAVRGLESSLSSLVGGPGYMARTKTYYNPPSVIPQIQAAVTTPMGTTPISYIPQMQALSQLTKQMQSFPSFASPVAASTNQMANAFKNVTDAANKTGRSFGDMITRHASWVASGLVLFKTIQIAGDAFNQALEAQESLARMKAITGIDPQQINQLNAALIDMKSVFPTAELREAVTELMKMGIGVEDGVPHIEGLTKALQVSETVARIEGKSLKEVAQQAAAIGLSFGIAARDIESAMPEILGKTAIVANATAASFTDIREAVLRVGPVAHEFGISMSQTNAILATWIQHGVKAESAGIGLRTLLVRLARPPVDLERAFSVLNQTFGTHLKQGANYMDVLRELSGIWPRLNQRTQEYVAAQFGMSRVTVGMILSVRHYKEEIEGLIKKQENWAEVLDRMATSMVTTKQQIQLMQKAWSDFLTILMEGPIGEGENDSVVKFITYGLTKSLVAMREFLQNWRRIWHNILVVSPAEFLMQFREGFIRNLLATIQMLPEKLTLVVPGLAKTLGLSKGYDDARLKVVKQLSDELRDLRETRGFLRQMDYGYKEEPIDGAARPSKGIKGAGRLISQGDIDLYDKMKEKSRGATDSLLSGLSPIDSMADKLNRRFVEMAERLSDIDLAAEKMKISLGIALSPEAEAQINLEAAIKRYQELGKQIEEVKRIQQGLQGQAIGTGIQRATGKIPVTGAYSSIIEQASKEYGIDPRIISAIIQQESGFNPRATSKYGAMGLMQLMPGTAAGLGVTKPFDPYQNIMGGTRYFKGMIEKFGGIEQALAAYNAGPGAVQKYGGIPPYEETQNYVTSIMGQLRKTVVVPKMTSEQRAADQTARQQYIETAQAEGTAGSKLRQLTKEQDAEAIKIAKIQVDMLRQQKAGLISYYEALAQSPIPQYVSSQEELNRVSENSSMHLKALDEEQKLLNEEIIAYQALLQKTSPEMQQGMNKVLFGIDSMDIPESMRAKIIELQNKRTRSQYDAIQRVLKFKETELKEFNRVENDKVDATIQSNSQLLELGKIRKDQEIAMNREVIDSYRQQLIAKRTLAIADIIKAGEEKGQHISEDRAKGQQIIKDMDDAIRDLARKSEQYSFDLTRNLMEPVIQMKKTLESAFDDFFYNLITGSAQTGNILQNIFNNVAKQISQSMSQSVMYSLGLGPKPQSGTGDILSQVFGLFNKPRMAQPDMAMANATLAAAGGFGEQPIAGTQWGNVGSEAGAGMAGAATAGSFGSKGGGILGFIGKYAGVAGIAASLITSLFPKVDAKTSHENRNYLLPEIDKTFKGMAELFVTPFKLVQTIIEEQKDGPNVHRIYSYVEKSMGSMWTAFGAMFPNITKNIQTVYDKLNFSNQMVQGIEKGLLPGSAQDIEKYKGVSAQYSQFAGQFGQTMMDVARQVWPNIMQLAIQAGTTIEEQVQALAAANTEKARQYAEILNGKMNELMGAIATTGSKLVDRLIGNVLGWGVPGTSAFLSGAPGISKPGPPVKQITPTFAGLQQFTQQQGLQGMYLPQGMYENYLAGGGRDTLIDFLSYGKGQMGYNNPAWNIPDVYASQYLQSISKQNAAQAQAPSILGDMGGRLAEGSTAVAPWQQQVSVVGTRFPNITKLITQIRNSVFNSADEMVQQEATGYAQALEQQWAQLIGTKAPEIKQAAFFAGQNVVDYFIKLVNSGNAQAIEIMALLESQAMDIFGVKEKIEQTVLTSGNAFVDYWIKAIIPDFTKMGYSSFRMGFPTFGTRKLDERFQILFKQLSGGTDLAKPEFQQYASAAQELLQQILLAKIPDLKKMAFYSGMSIFEMFEGMISSGNQVAVDILNEYQTRFDEIFKDAKDQLDKGMEPFKVYDIVRSLSTGMIQAYGISTFTPQSFKDQPSTQITGPVNISVSVPAGATSEEIIKLFQSAFSQMGGQVIFTSA